MARVPMRRGFAIRDLATLGVCAGLGLALMIPLVARGEIQSRLQVCMSRLKSIGMTRASYGLDYADRLASLQSAAGQTRTWRMGTFSYSNTSNGEIQSAADQAVDIIRFRGNRSDIQIISNWVSPISMSYLAMAEYRQESLPSRNWACPEDEYLLAWQSNPQNFNNLGVPSPVLPGGLTNNDKRWPYISSYVMGTSSWSNDRHSGLAGAWYFNTSMTAIRLGNVTPNRGDIGHRLLSEVAFPSAKVDMWDRGGRHFGQRAPRGIHWGFANAKQPILFFDGGVNTVRTGATNPGWDYNSPNNLTRSYRYSESFTALATDRWRPGPAQGDGGTFTFNGHFATTRNGLAGRDLP